MRLNRRLDGARFERDLTLKELALMAEVPLRHVQEACGRRDVERLTMRSALRLCGVLDHTFSMQVVRNEKRLSTGEAGARARVTNSVGQSAAASGCRGGFGDDQATEA
jgi:hypothetical protein